MDKIPKMPLELRAKKRWKAQVYLYYFMLFMSVYYTIYFLGLLIGLLVLIFYLTIPFFVYC